MLCLKKPLLSSDWLIVHSSVVLPGMVLGGEEIKSFPSSSISNLLFIPSIPLRGLGMHAPGQKGQGDVTISHTSVGVGALGPHVSLHMVSTWRVSRALVT